MNWTLMQWTALMCGVLLIVVLAQLLGWAWRNRGGPEDIALMREAAQGDAVARDALRSRIGDRMLADAPARARLKGLLIALGLALLTLGVVWKIS